MYSSIFPNAKLITLSAKTYDIYHFFQLRRTKLLQKSEMRKDIVIELSYKGFS